MPSPTLPPPPFDPALDSLDQLRAVGREFHARGWSLGTSSNYSVVASRTPLELSITVSGKDKSALGRDDFVRVNAHGVPCDGSGRKSSAETLLHCLIAELIPSVGAILHTHSVWSTILSGADLPRGAVRIEGYEMLKGLDGIVTHQTAEEVPIFANAQDMQELAARIRARFLAADWSDPKRPPFHGFLLSRHGLYTWGRDLAEARRQIEIHEFLFEVVARTRTFPMSESPSLPTAQPQPVQPGGGREGGSILRQQQTAQQ
jgi:methylthioribulose-1-phosphate dehydratase